MEVCITYPIAGSANRADVAEDEEEEVNVQGSLNYWNFCSIADLLYGLYKIIASNSKFHMKLTLDVLVRVQRPTFLVEWMGTGTNRVHPE